MIPLLSQPLIRKYFATPPGGFIESPEICKHGCNVICEEHAMAYRILESMFQPIAKDEKYLYEDFGEVRETSGYLYSGTHWGLMRLPDSHQPLRETETEEKKFDTRLEFENFYLKKENARLYLALKEIALARESK